MAEKKALNDVYVMRPMAIFLLVVWHSFIIYTGDWKEPVGFQPIESYWWLAKLSYTFMLELFVFVSGYVFGLTLVRKNPLFKELLISKIKRLIIPSLVFGVIYYLLFNNLDNFTPIGFVWQVLNGCGHMWFLPMLFWVTIIAFAIDKLKLPQWLKLVGIYCLPVFYVLPLPLRLSLAMYYMPFFYTGILVYRNYDSIISLLRKYGILINVVLVIIFAIMFISTTLISRDVLPTYADSESLISKIIVFLSGKYMQLLCAVSGVASVYSFVNYIVNVKNVKVPKWIVELNAVCFGVYLFQQFILKILYYKTSVPEMAGAYLLPWAGLIVALTSSYILTKLCLKTKLGKQLM